MAGEALAASISTDLWGRRDDTEDTGSWHRGYPSAQGWGWLPLQPAWQDWCAMGLTLQACWFMPVWHIHRPLIHGAAALCAATSLEQTSLLEEVWEGRAWSPGLQTLPCLYGQEKRKR